MFCERGCVNQTNTFSNRLGLILGVLPPTATAETARIMIKAVCGIQRTVIIRTFPSVYTTELGTQFFLTIIGRGRAQWAAGLALFIWVVKNVDMFVTFLVLARCILGRHP